MGDLEDAEQDLVADNAWTGSWRIKIATAGD